MSALTPAELEIYQVCSEAQDGIRQKELEKKITIKGPEMAAAVNGLLKKSLLKVLKDSKGVLSYKAVDKAGAKVLGLMDAEESIVYKKIQEAKNEGIWTKHLKSTELHQSVITRVLKSLEKKGLIKSIKSVKHPTRKIYILANLQPSVEVSGGPWYNNSEFETEFVQTLCNVCLNYIQKLSFPAAQSGSKLSPRALFPVSKSQSYPTAAQVLNFLKQTNITDAALELSHVESLLQVLIYDGAVEALPGSGLPRIENEGNQDEDTKKKRKKKEKSSRKGKKRARDDSDDERNSSDESDSDVTAGRDRKRRKRSNSDSEDSDGSKSRSDSGSESDDSDDDRKRSKKSKSKSKSRSKSKSKSSKSKSKSKSRRDSDSDSDSSESESEEDSDDDRRKSSKSKKSSKTKREPSPVELTNLTDITAVTSSKVYRAIRPERVALGWSQSPCEACPQFEFCADDGPVNPRDCQYYSTWLTAGVADAE
ncbi:DNA-directed RNA polymerase III subunit C34 [Ceratobasidium sp. AG-Ba]|nr:DNA-directed RNA polymerase III subunit C34 [Ceratobasidium sp. AG-Ba]QRV98864.1 DNA-directed RNA polymerase III subunit C34 [Ceratobasidium sp. AG-Ba]